MEYSLRRLVRERHQMPISVGTHTHTNDEIVYFINGRGTTAIGDARYPYEGGCFAFYKAGTPHDERNEQPSDIIWIHFKNGSGLPLREGVFPDREGVLLSVLRRLRQVSVSRYRHRGLLTEALLLEAVVLAAELQEGGTPEGGGVDWNDVLESIDENYATEIDMAALARRYGYSYDRFRHLFTEKFGISPYAYVVKCRIEMAKRLLKSSAFALTRIAYECGFESASSFSNVFKKHTGQTPRAYREANRK